MHMHTCVLSLAIVFLIVTRLGIISLSKFNITLNWLSLLYFSHLCTLLQYEQNLIVKTDMQYY